jgi:hypothetical protein
MPREAPDNIHVDPVNLDIVAVEPVREMARRVLVPGNRQRRVPQRSQFGGEGIDQRLEWSSAHQAPGTKEMFVCHRRPPIEAPTGFWKDCNYADPWRRSARPTSS